MATRLSLIAVVVSAAALCAAAPSYRLTAAIDIGGEGGWDYVITDPASHRLYASHATKIVVVDTETRQLIGEIPETPGVHGFALAPDLGRGFTSNGRANSSTIVDLATLKPVATVPTGANPDSIRYLADRKEVWTFNHTGGSITVFDPVTARVIATIEVGGTLEEAVDDPAANRVFVNVEDKNAIAVVDTVKHAVVARWPLAGCEAPTALAFDAKNHLLLSACGDSGTMVVVDSTLGKVTTSFPIATGVDGNGFDPATQLAFASSGTGVVTVAHEDARDKFTVVQTVKTQPSGRTMWLEPTTHRVFVPVGTVMQDANGRRQVTPETMKILVLSIQP
jgi:DNA-binding beta-propeller fold protein YncE